MNFAICEGNKSVVTRADVERARNGCVLANMGHVSAEIELDWLQAPPIAPASSTQSKASSDRPPLNKSISSTSSTGGSGTSPSIAGGGAGVGSPKTGSGSGREGSPTPDLRLEGVERVRPLVDHIIFADGRHVVLLAEGSPLNLATAAVPSFVVSITATAQVRLERLLFKIKRVYFRYRTFSLKD